MGISYTPHYPAFSPTPVRVFIPAGWDIFAMRQCCGLVICCGATCSNTSLTGAERAPCLHNSYPSVSWEFYPQRRVCAMPESKVLSPPHSQKAQASAHFTVVCLSSLQYSTWLGTWLVHQQTSKKLTMSRSLPLLCSSLREKRFSEARFLTHTLLKGFSLNK